MKKLTLITVMCLFALTSNLSAQIKVNTSGYVGINNTSPTYRLDVNGTVRMVNSGYTLQFTGGSIYPSSGMDLGTSSYYWYRFYATTAFLTNQPVITSDTRFKTNITPLSKMKDKVLLLNPVSYNLRTDVKEITTDKNVSTFQFGFIAQELLEVFPDMVSSREDGIQGIRYTELIPVLVQTIKEQQAELEALTKRVSDLESKIK
jgi:hypothetical protein